MTRRRIERPTRAHRNPYHRLAAAPDGGADSGWTELQIIGSDGGDDRSVAAFDRRD